MRFLPITTRFLPPWSSCRLGHRRLGPRLSVGGGRRPGPIAAALRKTAGKTVRTNPYPMTDHLFIRKDGPFVVLAAQT